MRRSLASLLGVRPRQLSCGVSAALVRAEPLQGAAAGYLEQVGGHLPRLRQFSDAILEAPGDPASRRPDTAALIRAVNLL
jgi:hypothetical protein